MAIKISGNTVIDDSRNITSSGTMSANAYIGDGSQLTNLPGGGNVLEATASGTLADGSKVIVNSDGTVSVVAPVETTGPGVGDPTTFESADTRYQSATYDSANGKVVIAYQDYANSLYGTAIVGTVSGDSISFGSPVVFESADSRYMSATYDSTNEKVVIAYQDNGNSSYGTAIVGTVSGTSISFGSPVVFESANTQYISAAFDSTNQKVVIAYTDNGNSDYGTAVVGTVSGTSISFGTPVTFESATTRWSGATYDSTNQKVVIAYQDGGNSNYGTAIVGTVSGTSISFGSPVVFESASSNRFLSTFDSTNGKVVIAYVDVGNSNYGTAIVGTVSGTSISFGSSVVFDSNVVRHISATYDSVNSKVLIAFRGSGEGIGMISVGTVSGTSISFTTTAFKDTQSDYNAITFDSANGKAVIAFSDADNMQWYGKALVFSTTGVSIPQLGSGTVFTSYDARFISAAYSSYQNKVVVVYRDHNNSFYGTAVVGEVSGTSISFGTPAVFESAATLYTSVTFTDYSIVIAYTDVGNSNAGTIVRCVTSANNTAISFVGHRVFNSGATYYPSITYDSSNDRVIIAYQDSGDSDKGKAIVARTAGNGFAFGTAVEFNSAHTSYISSTFDSSNNKAVISYRNGTNTFGTSIVGTVSGDVSISFGSPTVFEVGSTNSISSTFDSSNNKVVIAYQDQTNSNSGTAVVGTVSGTGISFGTPVVFNNIDQSSYISAVYDSLAQKVVITYNNSSSYGKAIAGTVSGTSISFGNSIEFRSANGTFNAAAYDSTNQKVVIAYADGGNSNYGTAIVFSPVTMGTNLTTENYIGISDGAYTNGQSATIQLSGSVDDAQSGLTPGSKYYVQSDGTLSTTADSPSVFAGTAVATTKLIVKN